MMLRDENTESSPNPTPRKKVRYSTPLVDSQYFYSREPSATVASDSPPKRQRANIKITWREPNPGEQSSLYPWYYGPVNLNSPAELERQRHQSTRIAVEDDDDATFASEDTYTNRLPVGLTVEDIQEPDERNKHIKRKEVALSTAVLVQSMDPQQVLWFLKEITHGNITRYLDWNKIQLVEAETQVSFGFEDAIHSAYITNATNHSVTKKSNQALDAYTIMEDLYHLAANTRGDIKTLETATPEEHNKMLRYRDLSHDIRSKNIISGIKAVEKKWKATKPTTYRSITTIRRAFEYLSNMYHPEYPWPCSHAWFEATLDIIRVNEKYCMLVFEEDTLSFLDMLHKAMEDAEKRRMHEWIEARTDQQFYDLMGIGLAPNFKDEVLVAPDENQSVSNV